ncbi:hypothetical protein B40_1501 [Lactococcus cremoris]|nr:hypothetical protein B40_1501 [Lactococcus cremoris]
MLTVASAIECTSVRKGLVVTLITSLFLLFFCRSLEYLGI